MPQLTFGGVSLLFDADIPGEGLQAAAQEFLDRYQPLEELALTTRPLGTVGSRTGSYGVTPNGLPLPNYPPYPKPRINELYWPTGAGRWAIGYFLVDTARMQTLLQYNGAQTLLANDGRSSMQWTMHALTAVPISCPAGGNNLWLLVLVDQRWFWQFVNAGNPTATTWSGLFSSLTSRLGITMTQDAIHADHITPDETELDRKYDNAALLLDAAAHSVGQRIIVGYNGAVISANAASSELLRLRNLALPYRQVAGGDMPVIVPQSVEVVFPHLVGCCWNGEYYTYTKLATAYVPLGTAIAASTRKTIHDPCWADSASGTPANDSTLDTLASRIASDYYAHILRRYDRTFAGLQPWSPTGFDDATTFSFGQLLETTPELLTGPDDSQHLHRRFDYRYFTRVRTLPLNFGVEQVCHQDYVNVHQPNSPPGCETRIGVADEEIAFGNHGTIRELKFTLANEQEYTGLTFEAWNFLDNADESIAEGAKVMAHWVCDRYIIGPAHCLPSDTLPEEE